MEEELIENCNDPDHPAGSADPAKHQDDAGPSYPAILDDDPALDVILLNEMEKEVTDSGNCHPAAICPMGIFVQFY